MMPITKGYIWGLTLGAVIGVGVTRDYMREPVVHAQSSVWETIAHPEQVGEMTLSIVRHASSGQCFVIVQSGSAMSVSMGYGGSGICDTPEESEKRKSEWEDVVNEAQGLSSDGPVSYWRWGPETATVTPSSQPSVPQTTKQPGVPR